MKMLASRLTPLAALLLSATAQAQSAAPQVPAAAPTAPAAAMPTDADPALWVVKDKDTTVYLFGTVHVLKPGLTWFDEAVKTAFDGSQQLVLELVEPDALTTQTLVTKYALTPAGSPGLTTKIPEAKRGAYAKAVADVGMPANAFERMKPWFAAVTLTMLPLQKLGYDPNSGAEGVLTATAKTSGKSVIGLETMEQQLGYFDSLPEADQVKFLTSTIDELPKLRTSMDTMMVDWAEGDPEGLAKEINDSMTDPVLYKTLLTDRNARWADWIKTRMGQPGTVFVAVGAGHLAGQGSVQDMLAKRGLKATRVKY